MPRQFLVSRKCKSLIEFLSPFIPAGFLRSAGRAFVQKHYGFNGRAPFVVLPCFLP